MELQHPAWSNISWSAIGVVELTIILLLFDDTAAKAQLPSFLYKKRR
jgi:hypothetical protein